MASDSKSGEAQTTKERLQKDLLELVSKQDAELESEKIAVLLGCDHDVIIGVVKSLESREMLVSTPKENRVMCLTSEGVEYAKSGTPEMRVFRWVSEKGADGGVPVSELKEGGTAANELGAKLCTIGLNVCLKGKWVQLDKQTKHVKVASSSSCTPQQLSIEVQKTHEVLKVVLDLQKQSDEVAHDEVVKGVTVGQPIIGQPHEAPGVLAEMKKRQLLVQRMVKSFTVTKGSHFALEVSHPATDISQAVIANGQWKTLEFKPYNFMAAGIRPKSGSIHPLMQVQKKFKQILLSMGFEEMPTNQWADTSFWNFDSLFMPQQHPARDIQDTFFLTSPKSGNRALIPPEYFSGVRGVHEKGGYGSIGWRYPWSEDEAMKNIMRTHTTAISARMLYELGQSYAKTGIFTEKKYFSIDRVFRNERLDETHLAEFHQVEGLVAGVGMNLGHLKGVMRTFYRKIGIESLKFKPAYNPYTEPSMEIFGYHPLLRRWIEVGNSGIFRPEMLRPMGLPQDVSVIAWGLSLERPTMIRHNIKNIRDLFSHKATLGIA